MLLILRITLAVVIFPHGAQKMLGWFDGPGFMPFVQSFSAHMHIPPFLAVLAVLAEFLGSIFLLFGFMTRLSAMAICTNMLVAAVTVHLKNGFFLNFTGRQAGEGVEFFILAIGIGVALILGGPGRFSVDDKFAWRPHRL
jgi:putative oxidoreductase